MDHEVRFGYLLKAKNKALNVFHKAHQNLVAHIEELEGAIQGCIGTAEDHEQAAKDERGAADYLQREADKSRKTADQLGNILGVK